MGKIKLGIVGTGARATGHGGVMFKDGLSDQLTIAALCDINPDRLASGRKYYEDRGHKDFKCYSDFREMYKREKLDGVFVAGPNYLHCDMTVAALEAGLNVLCEKPMEVTLEKCDKMIAAAKKTGKVLAMGMQMHYRAHYHKVREIIAEGQIGDVAQVWCTEYRGPYAQTKDWVWEQAKSGGAIVEKNCHHYDILDLWVQSKPTNVYASGNIKKHFHMSGKKSEIIDNACIISDYENGARAFVSINFLAEGDQHYREFGVIGTKGRILFSGADGETIHVQFNEKHLVHYEMSFVPNLRGGLMQDFLDCIRSGNRPLVTPEMGRQSMLVPMAAEKSIIEKRIVNVGEL